MAVQFLFKVTHTLQSDGDWVWKHLKASSLTVIWWILSLCDLSTLPWASCCLQSQGSQTYTMPTSCRRHALRNRKIPISEDLGLETGTVFLLPNCIGQSHLEEQHISSVSYIPHPKKATKTWHFLWHNPATNDGPGRFIHPYAVAAHPHTSNLTTVSLTSGDTNTTSKERLIESPAHHKQQEGILFHWDSLSCWERRRKSEMANRVQSTASSLAREASLSPG